jgi:hypothetical protein
MKAKRIAVRDGGYEPVVGSGNPFDIHDVEYNDVTYHDGMPESDLNTNFKISKHTVLDDVDDEDGDSKDCEGDDEDEGEEGGEEEEGGEDEEGEDDAENEEDDDDEEEDDL